MKLLYGFHRLRAFHSGALNNGGVIMQSPSCKKKFYRLLAMMIADDYCEKTIIAVSCEL